VQVPPAIGGLRLGDDATRSRLPVREAISGMPRSSTLGRTIDVPISQLRKRRPFASHRPRNIKSGAARSICWFQVDVAVALQSAVTIGRAPGEYGSHPG
jgi:hypothetical protein